VTALQERVRRVERPGLLVPCWVPRPLAVTAGNSLDLHVIAPAATTLTSARVGALVLPQAIVVRKLTYRHNGGGTANAVLRFAFYNMKADRIVFNVTDAVGSQAAANRTITLNPPVTLPAGVYHALVCLSSGTTAPPVFTWETYSATLFPAPSGSEWDVEGVLTVTGGAAPTSFDPRALTTPGEDATLVCRLDGLVP